MLCTTMPPAKSSTPQRCRMPPPQTMCTKGKYTKRQPAGEKQAVGLEGHAIGEGAGDERRRDDGEHHLVGDEDHGRNGVVRPGGRRQVDAAQADIVEIADDAVPVAAEAERVAVQVPDDRGPAHGDEALDHDGQNVLAADQPAVEKGEARRHQHDQAGAQNHEAGITGVEVKHENLQETMCGRTLGVPFAIGGRRRRGPGSGMIGKESSIFGSKSTPHLRAGEELAQCATRWCVEIRRA